MFEEANAKPIPVLFNVNAPNARLDNYIPKHGKADDAVLAAELQFTKVRISSAAVNAALLGAGGAPEVDGSFYIGSPPTQRFFGIDEIACGRKFEDLHEMTIPGLPGPVKVRMLSKLRIRFEGGPQQNSWADFSVFVESPTKEEAFFYHQNMNRDVKLVLKQSKDLIDESREKARGMAVSTTTKNGELDLDQQADANKARADALEKAMNGPTAEVPLRDAKPRKPKSSKKAPAKKAAKRKRAA